jgi:hypothetical protein
MSGLSNERLLDNLQGNTFEYFRQETNPDNGLVEDKAGAPAPASITAVGLALASYPVAVERGFLPRDAAVKRTITTLRFFYESEQSVSPDATGYKGFYYHFLDMQSGRRAWKCELSTIDTAFLLAGMLAASRYFDRQSGEEREIRELAEALYARADWQWASNGGDTITHGWKPERGFLRYRYEGYDEAILMYALALGSPTHALSPQSYTAYTSTYKWKTIYGHEYLYAGPLFIHQLSHLWIDFKGIKDAAMRARNIDYFENSRRAAYVQQEYARSNPQGFVGYNEYCWGISASDGPGPATRKIDGIERRFWDYRARGVPFGPDDGTIAPWAVVASLPFAPEIVLPTIEYFSRLPLGLQLPYGFASTFNATFMADDGKAWVSPFHIGLDEGPIILMIENHRCGLLWELMCGCPFLVSGLQRAGFSGAWLGGQKGL